MHDLAVAIPAYNEAATIHDIVSRCLRIVPWVIVVDDGSTDATAAQLDGLPVTLIRHGRNQGKAASLWAGMQHARQHGVRAIITLDGDGQHRPEDIPRLVAVWQDKPDHIIIGARLADKAAIPAKRYYANRIANFWIAWAAGYPIADSQSGFRIYPANLLDRLVIDVRPEKAFVFESEILIRAAWLGVYSTPVAIPAIYDQAARASYFHGVRDITRITRMVAGQLLSRGMYLPGLYRSTIVPKLPLHRLHIGADGYAMLGLSLLVMLISGGLTLLLASLRVYQTAQRAPHALPSDAELALVPGMRLVEGQPGEDYRLRLEQALRFLRADRRHRALLLGGYTGQADISEAEAGRRYLLQQGIVPAAILIEQESRSTMENLQNARTVIGEPNRPVLLVSNRYHLARGQALARGLGIPHRLCAAEPKLQPTAGLLLKMLKEGFHLHWYHVGRHFARLTGNQCMLARIT